MGRTVTLQVNLNVRSGPGTKYTRKRRSQLRRRSGKKHALNGVYAVYRKGTRVTIMAVRSIGADVWIRDAERLDLREKRKAHLCEIGGGS